MFSGIVVHGDGVGKRTGYPTANLDIGSAEVGLPAGVYAARATLAGGTYAGALIIQDETRKAEVYLFEFAGPDFYGERLEVTPLRKVSDIERCDGVGALKAKIQADLTLIKDFFAGR